MADHRFDGLGNHDRPTSSKPHKSAHPRRPCQRVPQTSSNVNRTLDNYLRDHQGYDIDPSRQHGSSSNNRPSNAQASVKTAGQLTATSIDFLTRAENRSLTPYPPADIHTVSSQTVPTFTHEEGDTDAVAYRTTFNLCDSHPLAGSYHHHSNLGVSFPYPTSNTSDTTYISDAWRRSYQTDSSLTNTYMDSTTISSNTNPYSQSDAHGGNPTLYRYGVPLTYSPPASDVADNHGDTTWADNVSSQLQGSYTHYQGTQPGFNDSGDPPYARRWSIENNQGSIVLDSASQATQEDDATSQCKDGTSCKENEFQANVITSYINSEEPWTCWYNMSNKAVQGTDTPLLEENGPNVRKHELPRNR